ncbi:hypothetical protein IMZ31_15220 [Pontibacillus sp. ALD_SL1]|uniref:hypothetical protein n=1 Tax=Pontibacillus sp. ALD_SL1 TaxID=2777185 RepID=UPI001A97C0E0|nr:hypothetical protein [Pontibacillus sp. ALD_SL1]QSS99414.1 hypothetical protein IMZ31_15220 [Pontibacillus sp. ALD_SL1]
MKYCKSFLMVLGILGLILNACGQTEDNSGVELLTAEKVNQGFSFESSEIMNDLFSG